MRHQGLKNAGRGFVRDTLSAAEGGESAVARVVHERILVSNLASSSLI